MTPSSIRALFRAPSLCILLLIQSSQVFAQQSVAEYVGTECKAELVKYCSTVTPGRARNAGCLLAHNDKLSDKCEAAFEAGLLQLSIILSTVDHVIEQCGADIDEHCDGVLVGGGRIAQCLSRNEEKLSSVCKSTFIKAKENLQ